MASSDTANWVITRPIRIRSVSGRKRALSMVEHADSQQRCKLIECGIETGATLSGYSPRWRGNTISKSVPSEMSLLFGGKLAGIRIE